MRFARWVFLTAALYGGLILVPGLFLEHQTGTLVPPPVTQPEFYYGFYGSALVWQVAFVIVAREPARLRPLMLVCALEKAAFFGTCLALFLSGRLALGGPLIGSLVDGAWMVLFAVAWVRSGRSTITLTCPARRRGC